MELLKQLYSIHSMSGQEDAMRKFVKKYVKGMPGDIVLRQDHGNIYITKGQSDTYPCLVAHLDQVQRLHSADFRVFEQDGNLFGFSYENRRLEGLGADDKNGIWIALKCLERFPVLKVAFFKEEEIGCGGSSIADMSFFKDCRYCLQADRKNGGDLIADICGPICSDEFIRDIQPLMDRHGYKKTYGLMTDVETLVDKGVGISCINLSCGYYDPHTDHESTNIDELYNALGFVWGILKTLDKVYPFTPPEPDYSDFKYCGWGGYSYGGYARSPYYHAADEVFLPDKGDYSTIEDWLWDFACCNPDYPAGELWPFVSADCEAYDINEEDFYILYDDAMGYYDEQEREEEEELNVAYAG